MSHSDAPTIGALTVDPAWKVAIVRSAWHGGLTEVMANDCIQRLCSLGIKKENIREIVVPGSFEIPLFCKQVLTDLGFDGAVAFGVVVQGDTHHARLVAEQAARGCMDIQLQTGKPVTFEVLFVDTIEDAEARAVGKNGKGPLAAETLLSCLAKKHELQH